MCIPLVGNVDTSFKQNLKLFFFFFSTVFMFIVYYHRVITISFQKYLI